MSKLKLLREATRPSQTVGVQLDGKVRGQIEAVEDALDRLEDAPEPQHRSLATPPPNMAERAALVAELDSLRESALESTLFLELEAVTRTAFRALLADHKPRMENGKPIWSDRAGYNADTFPAPLIKACIAGYRERPEADAEVLPMPAEDIDALLEFVTERQMDTLASAALTLCIGDDAVPLPRRRSATKTSDAA